MPVPTILDTDIGSDIDDTWALVMLLRSPELDPKLILTGTCDTVYRARLTAKLLDTCDDAVYLAYSETGLDIEQTRIRVTDDGRTVRDPGGSPVRVALRWDDLDGFLDHLSLRLLGDER